MSASDRARGPRTLVRGPRSGSGTGRWTGLGMRWSRIVRCCAPSRASLIVRCCALSRASFLSVTTRSGRVRGPSPPRPGDPDPCHDRLERGAVVVVPARERERQRPARDVTGSRYPERLITGVTRGMTGDTRAGGATSVHGAFGCGDRPGRGGVERAVRRRGRGRIDFQRPRKSPGEQLRCPFETADELRLPAGLMLYAGDRDCRAAMGCGSRHFAVPSFEQCIQGLRRELPDCVEPGTRRRRSPGRSSESCGSRWSGRGGRI